MVNGAHQQQDHNEAVDQERIFKQVEQFATYVVPFEEDPAVLNRYHQSLSRSANRLEQRGDRYKARQYERLMGVIQDRMYELTGTYDHVG